MLEALRYWLLLLLRLCGRWGRRINAPVGCFRALSGYRTIRPGVEAGPEDEVPDQRKDRHAKNDGQNVPGSVIATYIVAWPSLVSVSLISHVSSTVKLIVNPQRLIVFRRTLEAGGSGVRRLKKANEPDRNRRTMKAWLSEVG